MKFFLLVYDRRRGRLVDAPRAFGEGQRSLALEERFRRETLEQSHPDIEVVLLGAESIEDLQRTHSRYFRSLEQIASSS